jgi:hypothetical protein
LEEPLSVMSQRDIDNAFRQLLHRGFVAGQIEQLLGTDRKKTAEVLAKSSHVGERKGYPTYRLRDVAPALVKPAVDADELAEMLKSMHYTDLPMILRKEFWAAQKLKQQYEVAAGDLWPTAKVVSNVGELYKLIVMSVRLTSDAVERQVELSERQRAIIKDQMNGMLKNLEQAIRDKFAAPTPDAGPVAAATAESENDDDL